MLLNFYLATTMASTIIDFTKMISIGKSLQNKGYEISSGKMKLEPFKTILSLVVPGFNVFIAYKLLKTDEREFEKDFLKKGLIYKHKEELKSSPIQSATKSAELPEEKTETVRKEKTYDEMTIEEKRMFLLMQREMIMTNLSSVDDELNTLGERR